MTKKTLYLMVACCVEQTRYDVLEQVIDSIKHQEDVKSFNIEDDLIVFDNGSTVTKTLEQLHRFKNVHRADENKGYWSALAWLLDNYDSILDDASRYEYVYVIESDHFHYAIERLENCENALDVDQTLGSVRTQEYSVERSHLYNKAFIDRPEARRYACVRHENCITKKKVMLTQSMFDPLIWHSNFITCLHSMNRLETIKQVFNELKSYKKFSEYDFQVLYHKHYPVVGVLDGGVFHAKLGYSPDNKIVVSGSWNVSTKEYIRTTHDSIREYSRVVAV